ncbi:MAG: hypothetical protein RL630_509 [Verrucomicrobiota bacterium]
MDEAVKTANRLQQVFSEQSEITPRISANAGVLFSQTSRVENLVTARRKAAIQLPIDIPLEDGSQPMVSAEFLAEAGIAGRETLEINVRRGGREVDARIPATKILDLQLIGSPIVDSNKTSWGNLPDRIQVRVLRQLRLAARKKFLEEGLLAEADREFLSRMQALAAQSDCALVIQKSKAP